ncbi:MAG TPA: protease inhibitor I42 family protein [Desulfomonilaceae bacterium]|nr:protease inhibitor I42 family protein [Desulfomonilaceae bacterium]
MARPIRVALSSAIVLFSACIVSISAAADTQPLKMGVHLRSEFKISLESNPTTGYNWQIKYDEQFVTLKSDTFTRPPNARIGQAGTRTFVFVPIKTGDTTVEFLYKRSWEKEPVKKKEYRVNIKP